MIPGFEYKALGSVFAIVFDIVIFWDAEGFAKALVWREEAIGWQLDIMGLVSTIMLYRFPDLGWEGVEAMFNIQDVRLEDTRAYREIAEKQTQSVQVKFVLMQLNEKLGKLPDNLQARVSVLPSEALDTIGRALLYFQNIQDLIVWLDEFG